MNRKILIFLLYLLSHFSFSQVTIKGKISNENDNPLPNAKVTISSLENQIINYTYSDNNGNYSILVDSKGIYKLTINKLNYEKETIDIEITTLTSIEQDIQLKPKPIELNDVVINFERPITIKKDTIIFDAKSFAQGNEQVVEDLLKKIPGLTVETDGTIKVGNQEVEKVMIDGDDFFEKGYKLVTKNMPVNPIDKVELYQNYSNNKHLKGIENSQKVALNLTLKEDAKRVWFGNILAGYGLASENRYEARANLMNFGKKKTLFPSQS